jgi:hypothetical protein
MPVFRAQFPSFLSTSGIAALGPSFTINTREWSTDVHTHYSESELELDTIPSAILKRE